tara:strand:- start:8324 stop:9088 length:765 start_codon:yes stop_codon:yes gene_type:complete
MLICGIMQPTFLPWCGYFDMIDQVDYFVLYDDVQLAKRSWQVRNRIKSHDGEFYLTLPIKKTKGRDDLLIIDSEISYEQKWLKKHLRTIENFYRKSDYYDEIYNFIYKHYMKKYDSLSKFNSDFIINVSDKIGIKTRFVHSSTMNNLKGVKDERLTSICKRLKSKIYLSSQGSSSYIELKNPGGEFSKKSIDLYYHFYNHPVYKQLNGKFIPYLSILDLLFSVGFSQSLNVIRSGRMQKVFYKEYRKEYLKINN